MRAYFFTNMYLSSIQQGIQPLHVITDMLMKYVTVSEDYELTADPKRLMLWDWAKNHKTVICLNGGYSSTLDELIINNLDSEDNPYPWESFHEGGDALDGALTSVGIVLPERIYETAQEKRENRGWWVSTVGQGWHIEYSDREHDMVVTGTHQKLTSWEKEFIDEMGKYGLAK